jgi:hypothetical protein
MLQLSVAIILDTDLDWWMRIMGVMAVLSASGVIAIPILHRLSDISAGVGLDKLPDKLNLTCPRCRSPQALPVGRSTCTECGLRFRIEIDS